MKEATATSSSTICTKKPTSRITAIASSRGTPRVVTPTSALETNHRSRKSTQLQLPNGKRDPEALKLVIRDWLVPLLVKEFLEEHNANPATADVDSGQSTAKLPTRKR